MQKFTQYILYSEKLEGYYIGFTGNNVTSRLKRMTISLRSDLAVSMDEGFGPYKKMKKEDR